MEQLWYFLFRNGPAVNIRRNLHDDNNPSNKLQNAKARISHNPKLENTKAYTCAAHKLPMDMDFRDSRLSKYKDADVLADPSYK